MVDEEPNQPYTLYAREFFAARRTLRPVKAAVVGRTRAKPCSLKNKCALVKSTLHKFSTVPQEPSVAAKVRRTAYRLSGSFDVC